MRLRGLLLCGALGLTACAGNPNDPTAITTCGEAALIDSQIHIINAVKPLGASFMAAEEAAALIIQNLCANPVTNASTINSNVSQLRTFSAQASGTQPRTLMVPNSSKGIPLKARPQE